MAKGYWIAFVTVTDPNRYAGYQALAPAAFAAYGAKFLARGGDATSLEGDAYERHVIIEFDSKEQALACYHSDAYKTARAARDAACKATIAIVEGYND